MKITSRSIIGLLVAMGMVFAGIGSADAQTPTAADADFNGNGEVDIPDFLQFVDAYGSQRGEANFDAKFDLNRNGIIDIPDFLIFVDLYGQTVPAPALELTEIVPAEGMPGALIELVGRFDANTTYQVKFDAVLLPVNVQNAERITAMVPVLESGSVQVRVVDSAGRESAPRSFEVQALPEPRMNAEQLQQTVSDVGEGIENVLAPLTDVGLISSGADAALFNREMGKLNAAWDVLGERIAALPPEDAALLANLLDNSGALEILEGLGQIDLRASKVTADSRFRKHHVLFQMDAVSFLLGNANAVLGPGAVIAVLVPGGQPVGVTIGAISTVLGVAQTAINAFIPADLQRFSKVEIERTLVPLGGTSGMTFYGDFATEDQLSGSIGGLVGEGLEKILKNYIKTKFKVTEKQADVIAGFVAGILSSVGLDTLDDIIGGALVESGT